MPTPSPRTHHALIFDVDGTLVDSNDAHAGAWSDALRELDIVREPATIRPLIGMGGDKLLPRLTGISADSDVGRRIVARRAQRFHDAYLDRLSAFPGTRALFERLAREGVRLAIASSAQKGELDALLELAGVRDLIDHQISADEIDESKPAPDAVHAALNRLGLPPASAIMVGDTPYDILAAAGAGVEAIAFRCGGWTDHDLTGVIAIYDGPLDMLNGYDARRWDWPATQQTPVSDTRRAR